MERFITDDKLVIPENEIDNVYIWTQVSNTQEALLHSSVYYKLIEHSFNTDVKRVIDTLKSKLPAVNYSSYTFADYITFTANKSKIFNDKTCFAYMTSMDLLHSLACYLAHTMNKYLPENDSLSSLIINKIDEPDRFTKLMDMEFIILTIYIPLPEHKYKQPVLDMMLSRRSKPNMSTLIYAMNTGLLIGDDLISKERALNSKLVDLSPMTGTFLQRRKAKYQTLLRTWFEMSKLDLSKFVYSKSKPKQTIRQVNKHGQ